ncbi:MAG: hypothetical protein QOF14_4671 [Hyphomicrobiales bacterium]|nr:hypothetical protein [Hyphomicrobiales bacterium]
MLETARFGEYRSYFTAALKAHSQLTVRQETEQSVDVAELFTDNKQLPVLLSPDWQIVYGRRGTGKTTLLSFLSKDLDDADHRASLMISMAQCVVDLPKGTSDEVQGLVFFEKFIIEIGHLLFRIYKNQRAEKNKNRKITRLLNQFLDRQRLVEDRILEIATFAHRGESYGSLETKKSTVKDSLKDKGGISGDVGFKLPTSLTWPSIEAKIEARYARLRELNRNRTYVEEKFIDFQELRRLFTDLMEALEITQLVIVIDEWSELDRSARTWIQPFFAKYLRRAFFGDARFCIKISAIEDESIFGRMNDAGQYVGLQVGDDIFDTVNLDSIYANRMINLEEFYTVLLFRRLLYCDPRLEIFSRGAEHRRDPADGFLGFLFEDERILPELVVASSGIPRQFILLFETIASHLDYKTGTNWKFSTVRERIIYNSIAHVQKALDRGSIEERLLGRIKETSDRTGSRIILLSRDCDGRVASAIRYLYGRRLLHEINPTDVSFDVREKFYVFIVDHGCFLDWNRRSWELPPEPGPEVLEKCSDRKEFVVSLEGLERLPPTARLDAVHDRSKHKMSSDEN